MTALRIETAKAFRPLLAPSRYKGAHGGRGSAKSHFYAGLMIEQSIMARRDCVCLREMQKSLQFSVKKLLELKIQEMNAGSYFEVQDKRILSKHGGVIIFEGMQNQTAESIKSLEAFDIAWFEEAQTASQKSLDILRPTIRKPGSEMWFSWNPNKQTDPIDVLLRGSLLPPDSIVIEVNYRDNPWLPDVLAQEIAYDQKRDPDKFAHIWLGGYQKHSGARVFTNWTVEEFETNPAAIFRLGADWGFSVDPSCLIRAYIDGRKLYVDHEAWMIGCEIDQLPDLFDRVPESRKWFITADSARPETVSYMQKHGYPRINAAIKGPKSLEEGVEFLKSFDIVVHPRCQHVIDELSTYSYKIDPQTEEVLPVLNDKKNHCLVAGTLVATEAGNKPIELVTTNDRVMTRNGYKRVLFSGRTDVDRQVLRVETTHGSITCTGNHEVFTANKGFVRADALRYNDEVISLNEDPSWQRFSSIKARFTGAIRTVQSVLTACISSVRSLAGRFGSIGKYGLMQMVPFLMAGMSTTRTAIRSITPSTTLSVFRPKITWAGMSGMTGDLLLSESIWTPFVISLKNGTPARKALQSTGKSERGRTSDSRQLPSIASSAMASSFLPRLEAWIGSAPTNANPHSGAQAEWMTRLVNALTAVPCLSAINTQSRRLARGHVLTVTAAGKADEVFDLTIEDQHEFFANGVLVHNCIDALRYACEGLRRARPVAKPQIEHEAIGWMA